MNNMGNPKDGTSDSSEYWSEQGDDFLKQNKFEDAVECYRKALEYKPEDSLIWTGLGLALLSVGKYQEAVESFDQALEQSFFLTDNWAFRGEALLRLGQFQEAIESFEKAKDLGVEDHGAQQGRVEALSRLAEFIRERLPEPNVEAFKLITIIEKRLHIFIGQRLREVFGREGDRWWTQGIPLKIRLKCAQRLELDPNGRWDRKSIYNYTDLIDLMEILEKNWKHFEDDFERIKDRGERKKDFLDSLVRLNELRKTVMHPVRGPVTEEDLIFACQMRDMIKDFYPS